MPSHVSFLDLAVRLAKLDVPPRHGCKELKKSAVKILEGGRTSHQTERRWQQNSNAA